MVLIPVFRGQTHVQATRLGMPIGGHKISDRVGDCLKLVIPKGSDPVILVSLGERDKCTPEMVRRAGGAMAGVIKDQAATRATVDTTDVLEACGEAGAAALCEGLRLGSFSFDRHRSDNKGLADCAVSLAFADLSKAIKQSVARAEIVASAANLARELSHEPANIINPVTLAARARSLARAAGLKCTILDEKQMKRAKMGGILAVGAGSATPPRLIVLEHGRQRASKPVVLVGKAITFDTGGYSIKDKNGIVGMKYDKCGGVAVLAAMQVLAALKLKVNVVGVIAAAENMISADSYRPNDIVKMMAGKTVEIISTDAEGRMVLADALTYAQKRYRPRAIIDVATLTGGIVIALGKVFAGLFANNDELRDRLIESGERTYERLWPMPLHDDFFESLKSDDCDFKNSAGREGHAALGAIFLKQFVDPAVPWAHLDIAGVADIEKAGPYCPVGGTGFGVRLLCDYLERL